MCFLSVLYGVLIFQCSMQFTYAQINTCTDYAIWISLMPPKVNKGLTRFLQRSKIKITNNPNDSYTGEDSRYKLSGSMKIQSASRGSRLADREKITEVQGKPLAVMNP